MIPFDRLGLLGSIVDLRPESLPHDAWSRLVRVECGLDGITRSGADEEVYFLTAVGGNTAVQSLAHDPWGLLSIESDGINYWIYPGQNQVHCAIPGANRNNLTRQTATSTASITTTSSDKEYSATSNSLWSHSILAGVPVINVDTAPPQVWAPISLTQRLTELDWDKSAGAKWSERTAGAITCDIFRSYREYGIALGTTEGGTRYPRRLRWSHPAPPDTTPFTWDETKQAYDAGYYDFEDGEGKLVDCAEIGSTNYVYLADRTWTMTWVGGRNIHAFRGPRFPFGLFAPGCVAKLQDGRHACLTESHLIIHDGTSYQDIAAERWERALFSSIDPTYWRRTFLFANEYQDASQIWICYPEKGAEWCTMALVYDRRTQTFVERPLRGLSSIVGGPVVRSGAATWTADSDTWEEDVTSWNETTDDPRQIYPVGAMPATGTLGSKLWVVRGSVFQDHIGSTVDGEHIPMPLGKSNATIERIGLPMLGRARDGSAKTGVLQRYMINGVWPRIRAPDGTVVKVTVGFQETLQDSVEWADPVDFVVGEDLFAEMYLEGRIPSIRFESDEPVEWTLMGYEVDGFPVGNY